MSAHTPGPWRMVRFEFLEGEELEVARYRHPDWWEVRSNPDKDYRSMGVSGHIGEANARLIAAAPDLLEALELLMYRSEIHDPKMLAIAHAAIDKARGSA